MDYVDEVSLGPAARHLTDGSEAYGIGLEPDEIAVLQVAASNLKLFERS